MTCRTRHAGNVRTARDRFVRTGLAATVRIPIVGTWQRTYERGRDQATKTGTPLVVDIDHTSRMSTVHPHSFAVAVATAGAVEAHLRCLMHEHDVRLRARYRDRVVGGSDDRALLTSSGRVIGTSPQDWIAQERLDIP